MKAALLVFNFQFCLQFGFEDQNTGSNIVQYWRDVVQPANTNPHARTAPRAVKLWADYDIHWNRNRRDDTKSWDASTLLSQLGKRNRLPHHTIRNKECA